MHSIFFWGSKFIDRLGDYFGDETYTKSKLINISPVSDYHYSKRKSSMAEWRKELDEIWRKEKPEYLVLDLYSVQKLLYQAGKKLITLVPQNVSEVGPDEIVAPVTYDWKKMCRKLDALINIISSHFDKYHIILVKMYVPKYYVIDTQLRQLKKNDNQYSKHMQDVYIIGKAESYFIKKTGAVAVDLTKYYFYEKEKGYELTNYIYEKECFQDIFEKLNSYILSDGEKNMDCFMRPDFSICLKRYCKYYDNTILFDAFSVFLNEQNILENMILSSPKEFILNHFEELVELHNVLPDVSSITDLELGYPGNGAAKILLAYDAVMQKDYTNESIDYGIIFRNEIISQSLLSKIKEYYRTKVTDDSMRISLHNAGYYFARMLGLTDEKVMTFVNDKAVIQPVLVDVFGSCITRTCLRERFTENRLCAVNNYWFQVPAYETVIYPVQYLPRIFSDELGVKDRCVKMQFDHGIGQEIEKSNAQWLIVDLFSLITPDTYKYKNLVYTDQSGKISQELGAKRVDIFEDTSILGNEDEILQKMLPWCDCVKRKYGNHIILVDVNYSPFLLGDDNVIYEVCKREMTKKKSNFLMKAYDFVSDYLNCYYIKIACDFLSDERGYLSKKKVHYEIRFYQCVFSLMKEIITEEPEQKLFDSYPTEVRLDRIRQLLPENDPHFLKRYFSGNVDNWVLQLPVHLINKYYDQIYKWYDQKITHRRTLLKLYEGDSKYEDLANAIRNMEDTISYDDSCVLPKAYKQYDEDRFLQGIKVPEIKSFIVIFDGNGADSGHMKPLEVVWGVRTKLTKNKFHKKGYRFAGWKSVRKSDGKTCYTNQEKRRYYTEGGQPQGYELYYYPDNCAVATLSSVDKDEIILHAQWEAVGENES